VTEPTAPAPQRVLRVVEGPDRVIAAAFVAVPLVLGPIIAFVLTLGFNVVTYAAITVLTAGMVRSVIWHARGMGLAGARAELYRERRDATAGTSFFSGFMICLVIYDILPLPGGPFWTDQQPRAWVMLLSIIVYLVWAAQYARIPVEVRDGWKRLLGL